MEKKNEYQYQVGKIYLCWGISNRVVIGLSFFKGNELEKTVIDKDVVEKTLKTFMPKVSLEVLDITFKAMEGVELTKEYWNKYIQPHWNGLIRVSRTRTYAMNLPREEVFNGMLSVYTGKVFQK